MKRIVSLVAALLLLSSGLVAQSKVENIGDRDRAKREEIRKKDEEHRQKIMKKFYDFRDKVRKMAPNFDIDIPVDPNYADDIKDQKTGSKVEKMKEFDAWAADSYKLRSLPYDSVNEFTAEVKRGDRVKVIMKPDMKGMKEFPSITKEWYLVRTPDGNEGYIPANLLLNKKPQKEKKKTGSVDSIDLPSFAFDPDGGPGSSLGKTECTGGIFVLTGYDDGDDSKVVDPGTKLKVNTSSLKVRSEPSLEGEVLGNLYRGNIVEVIEYSSNSDYYEGHRAKWVKIKSGDFEGWVFSYYLVETGGGDGSESGSENVITEFKSGMELYVRPDILRVRDAPDELGTVLFSLQNKDEVEVVEVEGDLVTLGGKKSRWVKIKFLDYEGWVFGGFLSTEKNAFEQGDDINNMFQAPISEDSYFISSKFGKRVLKGKVGNHTGIDMAASCGTDVKAAADGIVIKVVENYNNCATCGYGSYVILEHKNGFRTLYGHLSKVNVSDGQKVNTGDLLGAVGDTGHSFGCHLHFEIRIYEEFVDPSNYLHP